MLEVGHIALSLLLIGGLAAFSSTLLVHDVSSDTIFSNNPTDYVRRESDQYNASVSRAVRLRAKGDLTGALASFSDASERQLEEYPNYQLWADIADLYCKLGKKKQGLALIREFSCAVDVMANKKQCWINKEAGGNYFDVPNPQLLPLCYATVCDRSYEPLYWQWSGNPALIAKTEKQLVQISRVRSECR